MSGFDIQYLPHQEIDKRKWDLCIEHAENSLIYAHSYYLDMMAENWDALVWEDYKVIMPLTWKRKFGIHYLYQPFLTAQLGMFGNHINPQLVEAFIEAIPKQFKLIEIALNSSNHPTRHLQVTSRNNFVLDLNHPYEELYSRFNDNIKRNIKKAREAGCSIKIGVSVDKLVEMAVAQMNSYKQESDENVKRFRKLYDHLHHNNGAVTYGIQTKDQKLVAAAVFFMTQHRAYYILVGNTAESKLTGASHFLVDAFIRDHAGKPMKLDFEGSDIPSLAFFYSGFGAENEKYPFLKINRLPFYLRWLKK